MVLGEHLNKTTYKWDALERMNYEQRHDWVTGSWVAKYDISQVYDKNGNRTGDDKNVQGTLAAYGRSYNLTYTYDLQNMLTGITDADDANWSATVTCDGNNNITQIDEVETNTSNNHLYTYFDYDALNRLTAHRTKAYQPVNWVWKKRAHLYDALGRVAKSTYKTWNDGSMEPAGDSLEHVYRQEGQHVQGYDGSNYGAVWHWAGAENDHASPVRSPNADTASTTAYNVANDKTPQRRTFINPTPTEGDQRHLWGQGRPMAKDSSGSGADWNTGSRSLRQNGNQSDVESRLFYTGTVTATDMDRATDAREKGRIGIFGTGQSYAGSYGRVTSESIGRDLNPLGRGDGIAYLAGGQPSDHNAGNLGRIAPSLAKGTAAGGWGNTVNNGCSTCVSAFDPGWSDPGFPGTSAPSDPIMLPPGNIGSPIGGGTINPSLPTRPPGPGDPGFNPDPGFDLPHKPLPGESRPSVPWPGGPLPGTPGGSAGSSNTGGQNGNGGGTHVSPWIPPRRLIPPNCCSSIPNTASCKEQAFDDYPACSAVAFYKMPGPRAMCEMWRHHSHHACAAEFWMCFFILLVQTLLSIFGSLGNVLAQLIMNHIYMLVQFIAGGLTGGIDIWTGLGYLITLILLLIGLSVGGDLIIALSAAITAVMAGLGFRCCQIGQSRCESIVDSGHCTNPSNPTGPPFNWAKACPSGGPAGAGAVGGASTGIIY